MRQSFYRRYGKRLLDLAIAIPTLFVLAPVMLVTSVLVRIYLGSPVLFIQARPGLNGQFFRIWKFRSMTDARDANGELLDEAVRLTPFGKFLRASSLDELPELWNVIIGEMSLVGPRPLHALYFPLYTAEQQRRHHVTPGVTGWAQVNGRNAISWEERFAFDLWYVDNVSFLLDLKILWMTATAVFSRKGITAEGHSSMPRFWGTKNAQSHETADVNAVAAGGKVIALSSVDQRGELEHARKSA